MHPTKLYIPVVLGLIVNDNNEVLVALRKKDSYLGGMWEFPGGKVEANEDAYKAICRELFEEIDIHVTRATQILNYSHDYTDKGFNFSVYLIDDYKGEITGKEHQQIAWVTMSQLAELPFPDGNKPIIEMIIEKDGHGGINRIQNNKYDLPRKT